MGKVGSPYGIHGWLKIHSFTDPEDNLAHYQPWLLIGHDGQPQELPYRIRQHGGYLLAQFEDCQDRDLAKRYTNLEIAITRELLPKTAEGEYYWEDLQGLTVVNQQGVTLGIIDHLFATGANDVIVVKGTNRYLIPFVDLYVLSVDLKQSRMTVDWNLNDTD